MKQLRIKSTPHKTCIRCGATMVRRQFTGRLESLSIFLSRKYCSQDCAVRDLSSKPRTENQKSATAKAQAANRLIHGQRHHSWKGGKTRTGNGYVAVTVNPSETGGRQKLEHILIAENVLGKPLPAKVVVHHHDEDRTHNENSNLVICENNKYHLLLHARMRVIKAGGNPDTQKICSTCRALKDKSQFYKHRAQWDGRGPACMDCQNRYYDQWKERRQSTNVFH